MMAAGSMQEERRRERDENGGDLTSTISCDSIADIEGGPNDTTESNDAEREPQQPSVSPQWGWYVAITPPKEQYHVHSEHPSVLNGPNVQKNSINNTTSVHKLSKAVNSFLVHKMQDYSFSKKAPTNAISTGDPSGSLRE